MSSYQNERHREGKDVLQPQDRVNGLTSSSYKVSKGFALSSFTTRPEVKPQGYSVLRFSVAQPVQTLIEMIDQKLKTAA
jgi:hypothetical protein